MIDIKFINATSVQLLDQDDNVVTTIGEFSGSPIEFIYNENTFSKDDKHFYHFAITGSDVQLSGTIGEVTEAYQYWNLFKGQTAITDTSLLALTGTTAKEFSYANMFLDCTNLIKPPTLAATTLAKWCYSSMFGNCSSLSTAPELNATTLADYCYYCMFYGCKSLSSTPNLPAQGLDSWCYNSMFYGCNNLNTIQTSISAWNGNSTSNWVKNVAREGYFYNDSVEELYGTSYIPQGWNVMPSYYTTPLTYKALAEGDNYIRLSGANSNWKYKVNNGAWQTYTNNDKLTLASGDTISFSGVCANTLTSRVVGNIEVYGNLSSVVGNTELTTEKQLYAMFSGQTGLVHASGLVIPFTSTSASPSGMRQMFASCTSLITAPVIQTTAWGNHGCAAMFSGCTSLTSVTMNWSNTTSNYAMQKVFRGCTALRKVTILGPTTVQTWKSGDNNQNNWLEQTSGAIIQMVEVDWTSWPKATWEGVEYYFDMWSTNPFLNGVTNNNEYGIFIAPASLDNTYKPSNWTRITKDANGVMTLSSTNRSEYVEHIGEMVGQIVWNDSTGHYDLVFAKDMPLTFKSLDGNVAIAFASTGQSTIPSEMKFKKNDGEWTSYSGHGYIPLQKGDILSLSSNYHSNFSFDSNNYIKFVTSGTGLLDVWGSVYSLTDNEPKKYCRLFQGLRIVDASNVLLSSQEGNSWSYSNMFANCSYLTAAPDLNFGVTYTQTFDMMFANCTSLRTPPKLNITSVDWMGCRSMFSGCTSLTAVPELPSSTWTYSFESMFAGCTALTDVPSSVFTIYVKGKGAYYKLFNNCSSLSSVSVPFTQWPDTPDWLNGVAAEGIFYKPTALPEYFNKDHIPSGWTVVNN